MRAPWSADADERLRTLWDSGMPVAAIGAALGVTKNAAVGRAHRLGLPARQSPILRAGAPAQPRGNAAAFAAGQRPRAPKRVRPLGVRQAPPELALRAPAPMPAPFRALPPAHVPAAPPEPVQPPPPAVVFLPRQVSGGCRWPMWGNWKNPTRDPRFGMEHRFCEAALGNAGARYCPAHAARAYARQGEAE